MNLRTVMLTGCTLIFSANHVMCVTQDSMVKKKILADLKKIIEHDPLKIKELSMKEKETWGPKKTLFSKPQYKSIFKLKRDKNKDTVAIFFEKIDRNSKKIKYNEAFFEVRIKLCCNSNRTSLEVMVGNKKRAKEIYYRFDPNSSNPKLKRVGSATIEGDSLSKKSFFDKKGNQKKPLYTKDRLESLISYYYMMLEEEDIKLLCSANKCLKSKDPAKKFIEIKKNLVTEKK